MSKAMPESPAILPKPLVLGLGILLVVAIFGVALSGGKKISTQVSSEAMSRQLMHSVWLEFSDQADGSVLVTDSETQAQIEQYAPNSNHFARGVLRGLGRERRKRGKTMQEPFELGHSPSGQLALRDPLTDNLIVVAAFGTTNAEVFGELYLMASEPASIDSSINTLIEEGNKS